jgi:hypothetical protein
MELLNELTAAARRALTSESKNNAQTVTIHQALSVPLPDQHITPAQRLSIARAEWNKLLSQQSKITNSRHVRKNKSGAREWTTPGSNKTRDS